MHGVLSIHKPPRVSSAWVVTQIKKLLGKGVKVGHAGTLDPFATGVLLVLVGRATKLCETLMSQPKQYVATIKLGATTETLDPTSEEIVTPNAAPLSRETVEAILPRFMGPIEQVPPVYSALKIGGKPAYKLARKGKDVEMKPRLVNVYALDLLGYDWPLLSIRVNCGRGTYIRSLARDIGQALGISGYLSELSRTKVGEFTLEQSFTIEEVRSRGVAACIHEMELNHATQRP